MKQFVAIGSVVFLTLGFVTFASLPTSVVAQEYERGHAEDDLFGDDAYDNGLYEAPYEDDYDTYGYDGDYNYELYDERYDDFNNADELYEDGYTQLYDGYDRDRGWGAEDRDWWENHPYYNEDEWYDPTDWFDGNNYELDEDAYETYRGNGYGVDEDEGVYEY